MVVKIKKAVEKAKMPTRGSKYSAGADLYACLGFDVPEIKIRPGETVMVSTGLVFEIPEGYVGLLCARSGLAAKKGLAPANKIGIVDSDFRGIVSVALHNHSDETQVVSDGERVAQMVITPFVAADFVLADELSDTERGAGGFGSTGER